MEENLSNNKENTNTKNGAGAKQAYYLYFDLNLLLTGIQSLPMRMET